MSDISKVLISKERETIEGTEYYKLTFFDPMEGEVITVMAPIRDGVIWVKPKPIAPDAQEQMEAEIRRKTQVTTDTAKIEDLQNDL